MDWFKKYGAIFNTDKNLIEFVAQGTRYQTTIEYEQQDANNAECYYVDMEGGLELVRAD